MRVLIVGSGGREHALAWACRRDGASDVFCAPGNGGTSELGENLAIAATDADAIADAAAQRQIDLVVVGPDAALAAGVVDACTARGIATFGPTAAAAQLETSKAFAKEVMHEAGITTAEYVTAVASDRAQALAFIEDCAGRCVIKADGLALGKGVVVCDGADEAHVALGLALDDHRFGSAGDVVVVERRLDGEEASVLALCDGNDARMLPLARDYKRAFDGDNGPNTGGMGAAVAPPDAAQRALLERTREQVVRPVLQTMRRRGTPFAGCLYVGLMRTRDDDYVLEFNARFGDPETQAIVPVIDESLLQLMSACAHGSVVPGVVTQTAAASVCVVAATADYPGAAATGMPLHLPAVEPPVLLFHAGTSRTDGALTVSGGRVLSVVATAPDVAQARQRAYSSIAGVDFEGLRYRHDIGLPVTATVPVSHDHAGAH